MFKYGSDMIFSSKTMSVSSISSRLKDMVLHAPADDRGEQGEMASYSLMKGIGANYAANQASGFFRPNAALAVVFVSDENDICAPYLDYPDLTNAPGLTTSEKSLRVRDCGTHQTSDRHGNCRGGRQNLKSHCPNPLPKHHFVSGSLSVR
jgi:hypothetical protein